MSFKIAAHQDDQGRPINVNSCAAHARELSLGVCADPALRSAPKIGRRRSQNRTIRT
jgi:hypothetical protein